LNASAPYWRRTWTPAMLTHDRIREGDGEMGEVVKERSSILYIYK
jgi:hypothetical protein